jgi:hypothetical protein
MKRIILIKTSPNTVLAHLYEHLYCRELTELFRSWGLMRFVDYYYVGKQYDGGFIHLEFSLFTAEAEKLADDLDHMELQFSEDDISTCLNQVSAEVQRRVGADMPRALKSLKALHSRPWVRLNSLKYFDIQSAKRSEREMWHGGSRRGYFRTLHCEILSTEPSNLSRHLYPLFHVLTHVLQENLADVLVESFGYYYVEEEKSEYSSKAVRSVSALRINKTLAGDLRDELEAVRADLTKMLEIGLVRKLADTLSTTRYDIPHGGPDELWIYEATGILVGATGWREIGTEENISALLQQMRVRLTLGRKQQEFAVKDLRVVSS